MLNNMPNKELLKDYRKQLKQIRKHRGIVPFCTLANITYRTFVQLETKGYSDPEVIDRVIAALQPIQKKPTPELIQIMVCTGYGITQRRLLTGTDQTTAEARHVAVLLMRKDSKLTRPEIQSVFGYETEAAVTNCISDLERKASIESDLRERIERIRIKIQEAA